MNNNRTNEEQQQRTRESSGRIYRSSGDLFICKDTYRTIPHAFADSVRGSITAFSPGASMRMRRYLRSCIANYTVMVTLTYPGFYSTNGRVVKEHLRRMLQEMYRYADRHGASKKTYSVFWFLEFQERGAPHFHLLTTNEYPKDWVARTWYRIVNSEDERHLAAGTRIETIKSGRGGMISYVTKYAAKQQQKVVPEEFSSVGRFWGVSGYRATLSAATFVSQEQVRDTKVKTVLNTLVSLVKRHVFEGKAEVCVRDSGVVVVRYYDMEANKSVRAQISRLSCLTMRVEQLFSDAELDYSIPTII